MKLSLVMLLLIVTVALAQEPAANLHDDGYWTPTKTEAGRALNERLMKAGSPRIPVYTHPAPQQAAPQAPAAPSAYSRSQHDADSRELRSLCIARDEARRERDLARAEIAGLQASTGHLSALVDGQHALLEKAKATMTALHGSASPIDESGGDFDARIPASAFARFVDEHAALLHAMAQSPVAAPAAPSGLPTGWVPCILTHDGQHPEEVAYGPQIMMDRLKKWLGRYFELLAQKVLAEPIHAEMLAALQAVAMDVVHVGAGENTISDAARAKVEAVLEKIGAPWPGPAAAPAEPAVDAWGDGWYLQDTRSYVGNDVLWWAKDGKGYTTDVSKAHVFTREEAFSQAAMRGVDRAWPKAYIDAKTRPAVDMQYINHDQAIAAQAAAKGTP